MPTPLSPDSDQDEAFNKGQQGYENLANAEKSASLNDPVNSGNIQDAEKGAAIDDGNSVNYTGAGDGNSREKPTLRERAQKVTLNVLKKRGGMIGLLAALGLGGGLLAGFLGPASLLFNLSENIGIQNDSSSTAMERRFMKVFSNMTNPDNDAICANSTKITMKCRMGRISNSALSTLNKKGVTAVMADGQDYDGTKKGYPTKNPTHYRFEGRAELVPARELSTFLASSENRKYAAQILGTKGAFNLRAKAWTGKYISSKIYGKFGINRNGGVADGENGGKKTARERLNESMKKVQGKIPGMASAQSMADGVVEKGGAHLDKAKKGGAGYAVAVASCIGLKAPKYIASGVAAIQLAQVLPYFMETIGGPASKAKQSAIGSNFTGEDADAAGTILNNKVNGKSALDSQILLAAMGTNKAKPAVAKNITPGYSILTNPSIIAANKVADNSEEACNAVLSPTAMYTAMATDIAITAATSATVVGGVIKVVASFAAVEIASAVLKEVLTGAAVAAMTDIAQNDAIPKAEGEELGDVIGVSAMSFYAAGGMARHLPVLTNAQQVAFNNEKSKSEQFKKEMDIAALSPFDTSSRYTFLGSIVNNLQTTAIISGGTQSLPSLISSFAQMPMQLFTQKASAAQFSENYGDYASDFGLELDGDGNSPCITASGLPCTGLTPAQSAMSTQAALNYAETEGWIKNENVKDGATIDDLKGSVIEDDSLLAEFIETCSNADTGDYIFNAAGCTTSTSSSADYGGAGGAADLSSLEGVSQTSEVKGLNDPNAINAMTPLLLDFQIAQSVNGEDDEVQESGVTPSGAYVSPLADTEGWNTYAGADHLNGASDWWRPEGTPVYAISDATVKMVNRGSSVGDQITFEDTSGMGWLYVHLKDVVVENGDTVKAGQLVGHVGYPVGGVSHLHLLISTNSDPISIYPDTASMLKSIKFLRDNGVDTGICHSGGDCSLAE